MICPDCDFDNIDGVDVCDGCGQPLAGMEPAGGDWEQCLSDEPISVLGSREPATISSTALMQDAVQTMFQRRIGCLLVVDNEELVGVVTERDVLNKVSSDLPALQRPVREFMTAKPFTVSREDSIAYALQQMKLGGYRHMPIMDESDHPDGIISIRDILRYLCQRFTEST